MKRPKVGGVHTLLLSPQRMWDQPGPTGALAKALAEQTKGCGSSHTWASLWVLLCGFCSVGCDCSELLLRLLWSSRRVQSSSQGT